MAEEAAAVQTVSIDSVPMAEFKKARAAGESVVPSTSTTIKEPEEKELKEESTEETTDEQKPKVVKGGFQKRIDRLIKHTATLEEENTKLKEQLAKGTKDEGKTEEGAPAANGEPDRAKYATDVDYMRALVRWEFKQEQEQEQLKAQQEQQKELTTSYNRRAIEAQARHEDWQEVVAKNEEPIPSVVGKAIFEEMENGPEVAYHLGKNPDICKELMEATPSKAIAMAWKISEDLAGDNKKEDEESDEKNAVEEEKPAKKVFTPIRPISGGTTKSSIPLDKASMADYKKARRAGRL